MNNESFLIHLSVLYRNVQKYYDRALAPYDIGYGQVMFLFFIYENEGITMQEVSRIGEVDKGTTTKSIQRLIDQGYVTTHPDPSDKRVKRLYSTQKAQEIMGTLYELRNASRAGLANNVNLDEFESMLETVCENSRAYLNPQEESVPLRIGGMQKVTLLDFPGKVASTVFMSGCSFKCPYCHNRDLVYVPDNYAFFDTKEVMNHLEKRRGVIDGVCISGGEPLLQEGVIPFIREIKEMGYLVKLDTNGYEPEKLKSIVEEGLVDYVAMDVKNTAEKYAVTSGLNAEVFDYSRVQESISFLLDNPVEYEFRTTVVKEFHTEEDLLEIAETLKGCSHWYLQQFQDTEHNIQTGFHAYTKEEMEMFASKISGTVNVSLRGSKVRCTRL